MDVKTHLIDKALQDSDFKRELMDNPKAIIAKEFCTQLPPGIEIRVLEETAKVIYIVLPYRDGK